ncbi:MAG TPA: pyridoxal phosphate-dependent aminotransferase [Bauldia sp.]|nr:pyridoxal phosphate-dependent aminotransferase [Bauldia sp.]
MQRSSAQRGPNPAGAQVAARVADLVRVGSREIEDVLAQTDKSRLMRLRGGPVLPLPAHVREAAIAALDGADLRPARGLPELREAIAALLQAETGVAVDPARELILTNGAMQGLSTVFRALLDPGDEVIVPTPTFFFDGALQLAEAAPVYVACRAEDGWGWDINRIRAAITARTRMILLCNPNNPTGFQPSRTDLAAIVDLARARGLVVVSDESFHYANYGERPFVSLLNFANDAERLVTVRSLSKSHALANWRMGYVHASPALIDTFANVVEWECLHCGYVQQRVTFAAVTGPQDWLGGINETYRGIRDRLIAAIERSQWITAVKPAAGPFLFPDFSRAEAAAGVGAFEQLLDLGVPTVPGHYFHGAGHVRLPIGADAATIERLAEILEAFVPKKGTGRGGK